MGEVSYTYVFLRLSENLRIEREKQGISLRKLGLMTGLDYTNLSNIENGKGNPTLQTLAKIASSLDIDIITLLKDV